MPVTRMTHEEYEARILDIQQAVEDLRLQQTIITECIKSLTNSLEAITRSYEEFNPDRREKLLLSQATLDIRTKMRERQRDYADISRQMMSRMRQRALLARVYFRR